MPLCSSMPVLQRSIGNVAFTRGNLKRTNFHYHCPRLIPLFLQYYKNVIGRQGLLTSDQNLLADPRTSVFVSRYALNQPLWFKQFRLSFQKMSEIGVLRAPRGQVRTNCRKIN